MRRAVVAALAALLVAAGSSGCLFRPRADRTRYYILAAESDGDAPVQVASGLAVGLGPVTLPGYLGRAGLVTRVDATRIEYAELDRWADPLRKQFIRALNENLSLALGGAQVLDFPWRSGGPLDIAVRVDVRSFENDGAGTAMLAADWSLRTPASGATLSQGKSVITQPAAGTGSDAAVAALNQALARFARELAAAIATSGPAPRAAAEPGWRSRTGQVDSSRRTDPPCQPRSPAASPASHCSASH